MDFFKKQKSIIFSILFAIFLIAASFILSSDKIRSINFESFKIAKSEIDFSDATNENVTIDKDGVQIIEISAKAGYFPIKSFATAGIPTVLKIQTENTFDCSSVINIKSIKKLQYLPNTGESVIDIGIPEEGVFEGSCGMGMYSFFIDFRK